MTAIHSLFSILLNRPMTKVNIPILANTLVNSFPTQSSFFAKVECAMRDDIITIAIRIKQERNP